MTSLFCARGMIMNYLMEKWRAFTDKSALEKTMIIVPYAMVMLLSVRVCELYRLCKSNIFTFIKHLDYIIRAGPHIKLRDLIIGLPLGYMIVWFIRWDRKRHIKKTRLGIEHGAARWGTKEDIKPFIDPDPFFNIILSATERLTMKPKMKIFKLNRNKHVIVTGGSGSGKTYSIVKPNLMQAHSSYVVTDPKGTLLPETGHFFEKMGYRIKVLDTIDLNNSMCYNPFKYVKTPKDILTLATTLQKNLKPPDAGTGSDPFWDQAALLWLQATIGYIWYEAPKEEQTISTLLFFLESDEVKEDDENYKNAVDLLFEELEESNPRHFAVKQRKKYKKAAGKTAKSILITLGAALSPFDIPEVMRIVSKDELDIDTYGDEGQKTILYVIISDTDTTYNFIPAILFTQMFNVLCYKADKEMGGKLKTQVQFILDEFANIGTIPGFKTLIATVRSRLISIMIFLQTKSQLKDNYKDGAETIVGNVDTEVFLGGKEESTLKSLEESLGTETIDSFSDSETFSTSHSSGFNSQKLGHKMMDRFDLNTMSGDKCIVSIRGIPSFYSDKYDTTSHVNYKYLADADPRNTFILKDYLERERKRSAVSFKDEDRYIQVNT